MSSVWAARLSVSEGERRLGCFLLASLLWSLILWAGARALLPRQAEPPPLEIEAQLVELPAPAAAEPPPRVVPAPAPKPRQPIAPKTQTHPVQRPRPIATPEPASDQTPRQPEAREFVPATLDSTPEGATQADAGETARPVPSTSSKASPAGASLPKGRTGARAIYQPLPRIPDELREEALHAVALARFHVAADGSVTVELVRPTSNPFLNRLLLETLKTWRFFPAMEGSRPVASIQEVKVHFDVK